MQACTAPPKPHWQYTTLENLWTTKADKKCVWGKKVSLQTVYSMVDAPLPFSVMCYHRKEWPFVVMCYHGKEWHWDDCALQVILSTNIAETSVTVPGVRYVVDTGFVKARAYSGKAAAECLQVVPVSQAQARQRAGRAGYSPSPCPTQPPLPRSTVPVLLNCPGRT